MVRHTKEFRLYHSGSKSKGYTWISPADNHDFCQDEGCQEIISKHMLCE